MAINVEHTLQFFLNACPEPLCFISSAGRILRVSKAFGDLLGRDPDALCGLDLSSMLHADDRRVLAGILDDVASCGEKAWSFRLLSEEKGASEVIEWCASVDQENNVLLFGSLRGEMQRNVALMEQTNRLARVGGWELDLRSNELYWTPQVYEIHETTPEEYVPTVDSAIDFYAPGSRALIRSAVEAAISDRKTFELQLEIDTAKGNRVSVIAQGAVVLEEGEVIKLCGAFQEISALREMHQERDRLRMQLLHAQKMEAMGTLAAGAAHDFNNVLTAIVGYTESIKLLAGSGTSVGRAVEGIEQALSEAIALTRGLLTFGRMAEVNKADVAVDDVINEALYLIKPVLGSTIELTVDCDETKNSRIYADSVQIHQVLLNLVINARDAMPEGGSLQIKTRKIPSDAQELQLFELSKVSPLGYLVIEIDDSGEGIAEEILPRIFDPFFTTKDRGKGTGLGLSVVHGVLSDHGGGIIARNREDVGANFFMVVPLCSMDFLEVNVAQPATDDPSDVRGAGTVLVAEGNAQIRGILSHALEQSGYEVVMTTDGDSLFKEFCGLKESPVLCVFDQSLPGANANELLGRIRKAGGVIPAVVMSRNREYVSEDARLEGVEFMEKPFSVASFLEKVGYLLRS